MLGQGVRPAPRRLPLPTFRPPLPPAPVRPRRLAPLGLRQEAAHQGRGGPLPRPLQGKREQESSLRFDFFYFIRGTSAY